MSYLEALTRGKPANKTTTPSLPPVGNSSCEVPIWWDIDNLDVEPSRVPDLLDRIQSCLQRIDPSLHLAKKRVAIGNVNRPFFKNNRSVIEGLGFKITNTLRHTLQCCKCDIVFQKAEYIADKYERLKEMADRMIVQQFIGRITGASQSKYVMLFSGDGDFSIPLQFLRENGYTVFLAHRGDSTDELKKSASYAWELEKMMVGGQTRTTYRHQVTLR